VRLREHEKRVRARSEFALGEREQKRDIMRRESKVRASERGGGGRGEPDKRASE
jgi:hypothetical protein